MCILTNKNLISQSDPAKNIDTLILNVTREIRLQLEIENL